MAAPRRNVFELFDEGDQIVTQDSDIEDNESDSDDEFNVELNSNQDVSDADSEPEDQSGPSRKRNRVDNTAVAENYDGGWTRNQLGYPSIPEFTASPGLTLPVGKNPLSPLDFFELIFTEDILKLIKKETNRYAATLIQQAGANARPHSAYKQWKPTTKNDIRGLLMLMILIHMSLNDKPCFAHDWSTDPMFHCSFCSKIMSRDRFCAIMTFLHVSNNATYIPRDQPGHEPVHKIWPIYDHLRSVFSSLYIPNKKISIGEAVCPWRGKLRFRVYMKDKPTKWGIKLYELCESSSGYVCGFEIYAGDPTISNHPTDVCLRMMEPYLGQGYWLYTDNYYTCPTLTDALKEKGTMTVGTVRSNRVGMPKGFPKDLPKGNVDFRIKDGVCALRWMDKKCVNLLSTVHDPNAFELVRTRTTEKNKPSAIQDYILNMAGVDHSDHLVAIIPLRRRTLKWCKNNFMHLFSLSLVQSQIIYQKKNGKKIRITEFLTQVGNEMAVDFFAHKAELDRKHLNFHGITTPPPTPTPSPSPADRLVAKHSHFPQPIPPTPSKEKPYRTCKVCYQKQPIDKRQKKYKRRETKFWYPQCKVALCVTPCFEEFHTKKQY